MITENLNFKLQPGDRVVLKKDFDHIKAGDTGTFVHETNGSWPELGVQWDEKHVNGHDCSGNCEYGYGWYVPYGYLAHEEITDFGDLPEASYEAADILFGL